MSEKFVFENARIKSLEAKLLTSQSLQRLMDCSTLQAAFKALGDMGFATGAGVPQGDFDAMFAAEESKQIAAMKEFNVAGSLDAFLLQYDFLSLKLILKAKASGKRAEKCELEGLSTFEELEQLCELPDDKLAGGLGEAIKDVRALEAKGKATPRAIDIAVDRRMYQNVLLIAKDKAVKGYFKLKIDSANLLSCLRVKRLALSENFYKEGYISGGYFDLEQLCSMSNEAALDLLGDSPFYIKKSPFFEAYKKALESSDVIAFEVAADNILLSYVRKGRDNMFSVSPILSYALQKQAELKAAKLIVAGIRNGVASATIRERLRDVNA